ncbi:MAG: hypothetical protein R3F43_22360 [bacterium]
MGAFSGSRVVTPGAVGAYLPLQPPPGFRHEAVIPSSAPAVLAGGLQRVAAGLGLERLGGHVQVQAEADAVRVALTFGRPAPPAAPTPPVVTPTLRALANGRAAVGAVFRPALLPDVMSRRGLGQVHEALAVVPPDLKTQLMAAGIAEVLGGAGVMTAESPDVEDVGLLLGVEGGALTAWGFATLTPAGAARVARGRATAGRLVEPRPGVAAWAGLAFDLPAALADAPDLPLGDSHAMAEAVMSCGMGCSLFLPLRMPFTTLKAVLDRAPMPVPRGSLPRAAQWAVVMDGRRPGFAVAADVGADFDAAALRLPGCRRVERGERATLLWGVDLDPRAAFDPDRGGPRRPHTGGRRGRRRPARRRAGAGRSAPARDGAGGWGGGGAAGARRRRGCPPFTLPSAGDPPAAGAPASPGVACLERANRGLALEFKAISREEAARRGPRSSPPSPARWPTPRRPRPPGPRRAARRLRHLEGRSRERGPRERGPRERGPRERGPRERGRERPARAALPQDPHDQHPGRVSPAGPAAAGLLRARAADPAGSERPAAARADHRHRRRRAGRHGDGAGGGPPPDVHRGGRPGHPVPPRRRADPGPVPPRLPGAALTGASRRCRVRFPLVQAGCELHRAPAADRPGRPPRDGVAGHRGRCPRHPRHRGWPGRRGAPAAGPVDAPGR